VRQPNHIAGQPASRAEGLLAALRALRLPGTSTPLHNPTTATRGTTAHALSLGLSSNLFLLPKSSGEGGRLRDDRCRDGESRTKRGQDARSRNSSAEHPRTRERGREISGRDGRGLAGAEEMRPAVASEDAAARRKSERAGSRSVVLLRSERWAQHLCVPGAASGVLGRVEGTLTKVKGKKVICKITYATSSKCKDLHWRLEHRGNAIDHGTSKGALRLDLGDLRPGRYALHVKEQKGSTAIVVGSPSALGPGKSPRLQGRRCRPGE
jgi:hypothetical protein